MRKQQEMEKLTHFSYVIWTLLYADMYGVYEKLYKHVIID